MATFKVKKKRANIRRKPVAVELEEKFPEDDVDIQDILKETREEQKFRRRPAGVDAIGLASGAKPPRDPTQLEDDWDSSKGGIMPTAIVKDRNRDRDDEDLEDRVSKALNSAFATETNRKTADQQMVKYIEERMKKADENPKIERKTEYERLEEELYKVPENLQISVKASPKKDSTQGMASNTILSGIPEFDLGVEQKIKNIEETERAKAELNRHKTVEETKLKPMNTEENYAKARFSIGRQTEKTQQQPKHVRSFEMAKKRAFNEGAVDSTTYSTATSASMLSKPQTTIGTKKHVASDDLLFDKFRKRGKHR